MNFLEIYSQLETLNNKQLHEKYVDEFMEYIEDDIMQGNGVRMWLDLAMEFEEKYGKEMTVEETYGLMIRQEVEYRVEDSGEYDNADK